ncbi:hypothetical protein C8R43DRAFT_942706 [Mycena crocata]|nr:hypothetical protein C8R43DRAFT_942706 [Mycena crocata]
MDRVLTTNEAPTQPELGQLRDELHHWQARLSAAATEMLDAEALHSRGRQHHISAVEQVGRITGALSALRSFPAEILSEIFAHFSSGCPSCLEAGGPLVVGQVCARWRAVSHGLPGLWDRAIVPSHRPTTPSFARDLYEVLCRSGGRGLHLTLPIAVLETYATTFAPLIDRIYTLCLDDIRSVDNVGNAPSVLQGITSLRRLSVLSGYPLSSIPALAIRCPDLAVIDIRLQVEVSVAILILRSCPLLEECTFGYVCPPAQPYDPSTVVCPALALLHLGLSDPHGSSTAYLVFNGVTAPALASLGFPFHGNELPTQASALAFQERSAFTLGELHLLIMNGRGGLIPFLLHHCGVHTLSIDRHRHSRQLFTMFEHPSFPHFPSLRLLKYSGRIEHFNSMRLRRMLTVIRTPGNFPCLSRVELVLRGKLFPIDEAYLKRLTEEGFVLADLTRVFFNSESVFDVRDDFSSADEWAGSE